MLSVSFSLPVLVAMLFNILLPGSGFELDGLNGLTFGPIPEGTIKVTIACINCKQPGASSVESLWVETIFSGLLRSRPTHAKIPT